MGRAYGSSYNDLYVERQRVARAHDRLMHKNAALRADLEALAGAGRDVLYHDERGQGVQYAMAMDILKEALSRSGVKEILKNGKHEEPSGS